MTEAEAIAFADKRHASFSPGERLADYTDDGDEEVLACVTSPSRADMLELREDFPSVMRQLGEELRDIGGDNLVIEAAPDLVTDEIRLLHKRTIAVRIYEQPAAARGNAGPVAALVFRKLGYLELKVLRQQEETKQRGRILFAALAKAAKDHVVAGADAGVWEAYPFLSMALGMRLAQATRLDSGALAGK